MHLKKNVFSKILFSLRLCVFARIFFFTQSRKGAKKNIKYSSSNNRFKTNLLELSLKKFFGTSLYKSIFTLLFIFSGNLFAQNKFTNYSLTAGAALNGNVFISKFSNLPGAPNCCTEFTSAFGLGYSFYLGTDYYIPKPIWGFDSHLEFRIAYNNLSAAYTPEDRTQNVIQGNNYQKAVIEHYLSSELHYIQIEPALSMQFIKNIPLSIKLGLYGGFPVTQKYEQEERLLSPNGIKFENGLTTRNNHSGVLPEASPFLFGISVGAKYKIYEKAGLSLFPEIIFNLTLTDVVQSLSWKPNAVRLGISGSWRIAKPDIPPPLEPILPRELPLPKSPEQIEIQLASYANGAKLEQGDTITIPVSLTGFLEWYSFIPMLYYKKNSTEINSLNENNFENSFYKPLYIFIKENLVQEISILSTTTDDEDSSIAQKRIDAFIAQMSAKGIDKSFFKEQIISHPATDFQNEELREENRSLKLIFDDETRMIPNRQEILEKKYGSANLKLQISSTMKSFNFDYSGNIKLNNKTLYEFKSATAEYQFTPAKDEPGIITFYANATNHIVAEASASMDVNLRYHYDTVASFKNLTGDDTSHYEQLIIGWCEFDKDKFFAVDTLSVNYIRAALKAGREVEILPLTDNIGTGEYNANLAKSRARSALALFPQYKNSIKIKYPELPVFTNQKPDGRSLNRTVIARIKV
ncbi:MAG: hypothetical protein HW421_1949 [Ignavibacteria bacterium]|nr:hypothetical protein [Ignavibacteria bacterium]